MTQPSADNAWKGGQGPSRHQVQDNKMKNKIAQKGADEIQNLHGQEVGRTFTLSGICPKQAIRQLFKVL